ncbi:MAG: ATP-binding cassette domain-containing protein, partial [Deltaproteobacteria bacterium]|nr:ATP-binding cassette domain-containing protein [Deltaproteobacteria bacterium]
MSIISLVDVSFAHEGGQVIFDQLNLTLDTNWKLGLIGRNGRGKTTFLMILAGLLIPSGTVRLPVPAAYFPCPDPDPDPALPG